MPEGYFTDTHRQPFTPADIRFTRKGKTIYAILMAWPGSQAVLKSFGPKANLLKGSIAHVEMLGSPGKLNWTVEEAGLVVNLPQKPSWKDPTVLKILVD